MAAKDDKGILLSASGRIITAKRINKPWKMVDTLVRAPAWILIEVLTITEVMGIPPIRPTTKLPHPWASNS